MRAVLDPNVIISTLLSRRGTPALVLRGWLQGAFELVVSPLLLGELERVLAYPKIARYVTPAEASELVDLLRYQARLVDDPVVPSTLHTPDPADDYLVSLAESTRAVIVSGDAHLQGMDDRLPVLSPAAFRALVAPEHEH